jgi:glycosyltransferase 2 family protein
LKKKQLILSLVVAVVLIALAIWAQHKTHFDFAAFGVQLAQADWSRIAWALACIYAGYVIRSARWAMLMRHNRKVGIFSLLGTQVIGFTAVALIGRVADLVRPYLVAKKTDTPISSQIAVYIVERLSDAGAMALIFSAVIVLSPAGSLPHPEIVRKAGYWGLAGTIAGALFLVVVRLGGEYVAAGFEGALGIVSRKLGDAVGHRIRTFRTGLDIIRSFSDFAVLAALSIAMWLLIAGAYLLTTLAFVKSPQLAAMTPGKGVLLMVVSGGASIIQLPVVGWFTQIGIVAAAIGNFLGASVEASTACAATLLLVTFLGIVPVGLVWAQFEHVSLRSVAAESEQAGELAAEQVEEQASEQAGSELHAGEAADAAKAN